MRMRVFFLFVIGGFLAGCGHVVYQHRMATIEPDLPASAPLIGHWTPVDAQVGGQDYPVRKFAGTMLSMTENGYAFVGDRGNYEVVYAGTPSRVDFHAEQGPNGGRLIPAIYMLSGDDLTICYQLGTGVRPRSFDSPPGSQILLVHFRRAH